MTVTAILLSYKREQNVGKILNALAMQTVIPDDLILINNNPEHVFAMKGVTVLNSNKNLGCPIRHAVGLLAKTSHCLFLDDDVEPERGVVENFVEWGEQFPEAILGYFGRRLKSGRFPYSKSGMIVSRDDVEYAHVVVGKIHFCRKDKLAQMFSRVAQVRPFKHFSCDDIALSLANQIAGCQNYVIPTKEGNRVIEMDEHGIGLGMADSWWQDRDDAVRAMLGGE